MRICVFCSSSDAVNREFFQAARELGEGMARRGHSLVFGGGRVGLMGELARAVHAVGAAVVGVMPDAMRDWNVAYDQADEMIYTATMNDRKKTMQDGSDAFIALAGGLGTFEELLEVITLKQLHYHTKPIVILNTAGYFDPLLALLDHAVSKRFMKSETTTLYHVCRSPGEALDYIERYEPPAEVPRFFVELRREDVE